MFYFIVGGKYVLSSLNLTTTFGVVVSEFKNNFWRENCREQYDFTKPLKFFP